mmetsp:Transcript_59026/g.70398  ORF Transcript_59026/g.70398 Transcript_59026/m.70398 type:complete len:84 (+) Transcript_59026:316-567(+)
MIVEEEMNAPAQIKIKNSNWPILTTGSLRYLIIHTKKNSAKAQEIIIRMLPEIKSQFGKRLSLRWVHAVAPTKFSVDVPHGQA